MTPECCDIDAKGDCQVGGNGHFIAVLGKTADGKYLVADPMYTGGTMAMTRDELAVFFKPQNDEPSFVARPFGGSVPRRSPTSLLEAEE